MKAIDRAKAHFEQVGIRRFEVPEWGDDSGPFVVFSKPMTVADKNAINANLKGDSHSIFVETVVRMALDANGEKVFTIEDKAVLKRAADATVIERLALQIMAAPKVEDLAKN